jgi:molybdopterin converting factor subunit 1
MRVDVLYFGMLKELFGGERETLELEAGARVEDALRVLRARASNGLDDSGVWKALAVAVNREYAGVATVLKDRDELALLPPVSGGFDLALGEGT